MVEKRGGFLNVKKYVFCLEQKTIIDNRVLIFFLIEKRLVII